MEDPSKHGMTPEDTRAYISLLESGDIYEYREVPGMIPIVIEFDGKRSIGVPVKKKKKGK
jgi:hypothetical protein